MNIYDEAIEDLRSVMAKFIIPNVEDTDYGCLYDSCHFYNTLDDEENKRLRNVYKALERAKKVEEELKYTKEQFDKYWKEVCILKPRLAKVEELLELYRLQKIEAQEKRLNDITLYWVYENKIKELEKELEEELK